MSLKDYAAIATQYAHDVVDGRIIAARYTRLACERHLRDLARAEAGDWRYAWNIELRTADTLDEAGKVLVPGKVYRPADRVCMFAELMPHIKGEWAARGERIRLQPWQVFILASIFGWVDRETKRRRFRIADLFVPRKNAKSTLASVIGLYMLACDGEFGAEVYSGATSEEQAGEVFRPARLMAERSPDFRARFGVLPRASNISVPDTNSKFEPVIGKPGDGASPSCAIVDEYHEHPTEDLFDTMRTGMGARSQPLMLVITTAGDNIAGPCYAHEQELRQILDGLIEDDQRFGILYGTDEADDWTSEEALLKANPNFGVSIDPEFLITQQRDAIRDPRKQSTFKTKHLNQWVQSASPWLNLHDWKQLADRSLKFEDFAGEQCIEGLDLANTTDIASRCKWFTRDIEGVEHHYVFWQHYLPEAAIEEPENKHYQGWEREGWLTKTAGSMIDQDQIEQDIEADAALVALREVAIDAWGSPGIAAALANKGIEVVRIPQTVAHLSAPMKWIDGLVKSRRLHHCGDPVATWGVSNVEVKPDRNDNWFPRRGNRSKKIDPAVAMLNAAARAMIKQDDTGIDDWLRAVRPPAAEAERTVAIR